MRWLRWGLAMRGQASFFDVDERLKELSSKCDDLERLNGAVDFEVFQLHLARAAPLALVGLFIANAVLAQDFTRFPSPTYNNTIANKGTIESFKVLAPTDDPLAISYVSSVPQNDFFARTHIRSPGRGTHPTKSISEFSIFHDADGSGGNGPLASDQGAVVAVSKKNYPVGNSGEIDVLNLFARQSGPTPTTDAQASDLNVISGNYAMAGTPGYAAWMEFRAVQQDKTAPYTVNKDFGVQIGVIDPFGGNGAAGLNRYAGVSMTSWVYGAFANAGTIDRALYVDTSGAGTFTEYVRLSKSGIPFFTIDATGKISSGGEFSGAAVTIQGVRMLSTRNTLILPAQSGTSLSTPTAGELYLQSGSLRYYDGAFTQSLQTVTGAWTAYTPTVTAGVSGTFGTTNRLGRYQVTGKRLDLNVGVQWDAGEASSASGSVNLTLPPGVAVAAYCVGAGRDNANGPGLQAFITPGASYVSIIRYDNTTPIADVVDLHAALTCEIN